MAAGADQGSTGGATWICAQVPDQLGMGGHSGAEVASRDASHPTLVHKPGRGVGAGDYSRDQRSKRRRLTWPGAT